MPQITTLITCSQTLTTSVDQRFTPWALYEKAPGPFPVRSIGEINFSKLVVVRVFWKVLQREFRCSETHSAGNSLV